MAKTSPNRILALLLAVYTFNYIDRQIIGILAGPIKAELHLSDKQLGVLGGLAFAILFTTLGIPMAILADATRRSRVIAGSLAIWSGFTAACGLAGGFASLALCRVGVGFGEAGGVAPSYALIADAFPPERRARALGIYSLGIPLGSALGALFGGWIAATVDWRTAFVVVGLAGLVLAPLFLFAVREPRSAALAAVPVERGALRALLARPTFWLLAFGAASSSMMGYGLAFWMPSLMKRSFGMDLIAVSRFTGFLFLFGGSAGVLAGGWLADRLGGSDRAAYARIPAIAFAVAVPLWAAGMLVHSATASFLLFLVPQALVYMWLAPVITAIQHLVPPPQRATASASFLLVNNLVGLGFGSLAIGALSDALAPAWGEEALRVALLAGLGLYLTAAVLLLIAAPRLRKDWVAA